MYASVIHIRLLNDFLLLDIQTLADSADMRLFDNSAQYNPKH